VNFTSTSTDPDGDALTHRWDFGDGTTSRSPAPVHDFPRPGTYRVVLLVTDGRGAVAQVTVTVVIQDGGTVDVGAPAVTTPPPAPPVSGAGVGTPRLDPFPTVRVTGRVLGRSTSIRTLSVRGPRGATVRITCRRGSCRKAVRQRLTISRRGRSETATVRLRRFERRLRAGTILEIRVTRGETVGKYTRLRVTTGRAPARIDRCLLPGRSAPVRCGAG
jgi:hypothetical protein